MKGILADENLEGHVRRLVAHITASVWIDDWKSLGLSAFTFPECGLKPGTNDRDVYAYCQRMRVALVTANRNADGATSLEAAIRDGEGDDIPALTLSDADRILTDPAYAQAVAFDLLDALDSIVTRPDTILGTGRVYLPRRPVL